jgi:hypothetical protein
MTNFRRFALFVLLCGLLFSDSLRVRVEAQQDFQVTNVVLKAGDANPSGKCPVTIKFAGAITANGKGAVQYTFTRNDGATSPIQTLSFTEAGTQTVSTDWTLGDASLLPHYEGWQAIKILSPNQMESSHETASFIMNCGSVPSQPIIAPTPTYQNPNVTTYNPGTFQNTLPRVLKERVTIPKPDFIKLIPEKNFAGIFIIKFVEGSHIRYEDRSFRASKDRMNKEEVRRLERLNLSAEKLLEPIKKVNELVSSYSKRYGFVVISAFVDERSKRDPAAQFREKERLEIVSGEELADLDLYFVIGAKDFKDIEAQQEFMNALNKSVIIEDVHAAFLTENAEVKTDGRTGLLNEKFSPLDTPDFSSQQRYLDAAPVGIDARYAWTIPGGRGLGTKVIDVEYDWQTNHEDFASATNLFWGGRAPIICSAFSSDTNHGTAVMGVLNGRHNGLGVSGITPDVSYGLASVCRADYVPGFFFSLFTGENVIGRTHNFAVARAIIDAARVLGRGDVLLIEQHTKGPIGEWVPMEYYQESFDAIRRAMVEQHIVVVEAAGNGGMNLDDVLYNSRFNPTSRNSGALLVGASNGNGDTDRASFSNFGSRVDVHGWGGGVVTLGYGVDAGNSSVPPWNLGDVTRYYTQRFGGTSSASPIVAGAVASIQGARRARSLEPLDSSLLRMLFASTGTPQGSASAGGNIGPLPNLRRAIDTTLGGTSRGGFTGPGTYFIQARHSNKVLDINVAFFTGQLDGRPLAQFDNYNGDNQKFIVEPLPGGFVSIKAKHSGKCLDVADSSRGPAGLQQWSCTGWENQQFMIEAVGDFYKIRARHSGLYFDVSGGDLNNAARLIQYQFTGGSNQLFQFIPTR